MNVYTCRQDHCHAYHFYYDFSIHTVYITSPCDIGNLFISIRPQGIWGPDILKIGWGSLKTTMFSSINISPRKGFEKLKQVKRKSEREKKRKDSVNGSGMCRWGNRSREKPVVRGNYVSGVWASKQNSHSYVAFCFRCVSLCSEISASTGLERCSFCSLWDFPNPWNEHLCRGWTPEMTQPDLHTETHTQYACAYYRAQQISSFVELAQFDRYQK